jgi:GntR family transcriptional repressor for pyruvate dehydrogenase complex
VVALVLRSRGAELRDVFESMSLLEPVCAMLCARRADRATTVVAELRELNAAARRHLEIDDLAYAEAMAGFHEALVRGCGNETLTLVAGILESIWLVHDRTRAEAATTRGALLSRAEKVGRIEAHEQIRELIEAGDDQEVTRVVTEHLEIERGFSERIASAERVDARSIRRD